MKEIQNRPHLALGLPDDKVASCYVDEQGAPQFSIPNQMRLPSAFLAGLESDDQFLWLPRRDKATFSVTGPVINCCADFDGFRKALAAMRDWIPAGALVFNHPTAVAHTASVQLRERLAGLDGLSFGQQIRILPKSPEDFGKAAREAGMVYPLRVQFADFQGNTPQAIIRKEEDWEDLLRLQWPGRRFTILQLGQDDLAQHLRIRISVVGSQAEQFVFPYAYPGTALVKDFASKVPMDPQKFRTIFAQIARHIMLDYWTIELSFKSATEVRVEYIWPALPLPPPGADADPSTALWPRVSERLNELLSSPQKWRSAATGKTQRRH